MVTRFTISHRPSIISKYFYFTCNHGINYASGSDVALTDIGRRVIYSQVILYDVKIVLFMVLFDGKDVIMQLPCNNTVKRK